MFVICNLCGDYKKPSEIIALNCKHCFCLVCFEKYLLDNLSVTIKCPEKQCQFILDDPSIRAVLSDDDLGRYDMMCLISVAGTHKCILPDCGNVRKVPDGVFNYTCEKCTLWNCVRCDASHRGVSCEVFSYWSKEQVSERCSTAMEKAETVRIQKTKEGLIKVLSQDLYVNDKVFECNLCFLCIGKGNGVRLRNCFHYVCRPCLINLITNSKTIRVKCPNGSCDFTIEDREKKSVLSPEQYSIHERDSMNGVVNKLENAFICQQPNCDYICELGNPNNKKFKCQKCKTWNCLRCPGVHPNQTCAEFKQGTQNVNSWIDQSILEGKYMSCPVCKILVSKSRGCNWIKCPKCDLELCWMLKMPRWGPKGRGDTSGGCKCRENKLCHPACTGCIPDH